MADLAQTIQQEITEAAAEDELDLPTLPEVALRIRDVADDPDASLATLAAVISEDPALTLQVVKVANSAMFRAAQPIDDIGMAVGRLGLDYTCNVATGFAMQNMFQATSDIIDRKLREVWTHAKDVAAIANVLAKSFTSLAPDKATLAGLTHNIGALPVLTWAEENDNLIRDSFTLDRVIDGVQGSLGTMILSHWNFPEELIAVPSNVNDFGRDAAEADYVDVVQVANLQSVVGTNHPLTQIDWASVTAFPRVGIESETAHQTLAEYSDVFQMAKEVFG